MVILRESNIPQGWISYDIECTNSYLEAVEIKRNFRFWPCLRSPSKSSFLSFKKLIKYSPMVLFTHNIKNIKSATHRNSYFDGKCEQGFTFAFVQYKYPIIPFVELEIHKHDGRS